MKDIFNKIYIDLLAKKTNWSNSSEVDFKSDLLSPLITNKNIILLGCGDFSLGFALVNRCNAIAGIDFSDVALRAAKERPDYDSEKMSLRCFDISKDSPQMRKFDVVVDDYLSHCIVENRNVYFENVRALMNEGSLYVTFAVTWPEGFRWPDFVASSLDPNEKAQKRDGITVRVLKDPKTLLEELRENGFSTEYHQVIFNPTGQPIFFSVNRAFGIGAVTEALP